MQTVDFKMTKWERVSVPGNLPEEILEDIKKGKIDSPVELQRRLSLAPYSRNTVYESEVQSSSDTFYQHLEPGSTILVMNEDGEDLYENYVYPTDPKATNREVIRGWVLKLLHSHIPDIIKWTDILLSSGAINVEGYDRKTNPILIPHHILQACFERAAQQHDLKNTQWEEEAKEEVANYKRFV